MPLELLGGCRIRSGVIVDVARAGGLDIRITNKKSPICCPFHDDRNASAFINPESNVFYCSVCTPGKGWTAKRFAEALGVPWPPPNAFDRPSAPPPPSRRAPSQPPFSPAVAQKLWRAALDRARDDDRVEEDREVYDYLNRRGLGQSWEFQSFGVLGSGMSLERPIAWWPENGYRLVAPLYDDQGLIVNVQARTVRDIEPKTRFPADSVARGTVFADPRGIEILRGIWSGARSLILGEGLTDFLAVSTVSPVPVLSAPGTGMAPTAFGPWVKGFEVFLALDWDGAGHSATAVAAGAAKRNGAVRVRRFEWPRNCKDACDVVATVGLEGLGDFLSHFLGGAG